MSITRSTPRRRTAIAAASPSAAGPPFRLRLEENFRSLEPVLTVANGLIGCNVLRYEPDKVLRPTRGSGPPVELVIAAPGPYRRG